MNKNALIINQSQQKGIESYYTEKITSCLHNTIRLENKIEVEKVKQYRLLDLNSSDNLLLSKSINDSNNLYQLYRNQGLAHKNILQLDIHLDSNDTKSSGFSLYHLGDESKKFVDIYSLDMQQYFRKNIIENTSKFLTLRESKARNILIEVCYYDNVIDIDILNNNLCSIVATMKNSIYKYFEVI